MADGLPRTRNELKNWVLRKLGAPVLEVNLDEDQIEDRLSEGLAYFRDYHFDGVERVLYKHKVTASKLVLAAAPTGTFIAGECIEGATSGASTVFLDQATDNLSVRVKGRHTSEFVNGEVITGQSSGATATLASTLAVQLGDIDNGWIPVDDSIIGVTDILPFDSGLPNAGGMFDINYQFALNSMHSLISTDLITYDMFRRQMELLRFEFSGTKGLRFNRKTDKIYVDIDWISGVVQPDSYLVIIAYKAVDPEVYSEVYSDYFVREYCYALMKEQWGEVLKKYSGIALPGNVTLNGQQIYDEGIAYRQKLEDRIKKEWELPVDFLIG